MIKVDYPEYDTFVEYPDGTPSAEIEKASFANFPPVDQIRDVKGQWRIDVTALPKLPVAYAEDMAKAGKESGVVSGARKSFAGTLESLADIAERPGLGLDEIIGKPMGDAIRGAADYVRPPETPEYTPQTFGQKLREAAGYATAELPKYMVAGRLTAKPVERLVPALEGIGEKIAEKVAAKGVTGLAGRLAEKAPAILPEMAKQATTFGAVGAFDEGPSGAAHGAATAVPFTLGMLPAKRLYRALAGGTAGAGMAAATGGSEEDIAINGLLMGFLGGLTPQIKNKIKFEIESNPEVKISELPTVMEIINRTTGVTREPGRSAADSAMFFAEKMPITAKNMVTEIKPEKLASQQVEAAKVEPSVNEAIAHPEQLVEPELAKVEGIAEPETPQLIKTKGMDGTFYLAFDNSMRIPSKSEISDFLDTDRYTVSVERYGTNIVSGVRDETRFRFDVWDKKTGARTSKYDKEILDKLGGFRSQQSERLSAAEAMGISPVEIMGKAARAMVGRETGIAEPAKVKGIAEPAPAAKQPWEMTRADIEIRYPKASGVVDGRKVRDEIPNMGSIESSVDNATILPGIYEIPLSEFGLTGRHYSVEGTKRINELASEIGTNKEINPLIVVIDADGPYILEGATRSESLYKLGAKSLPAKVVIDEGSFYDAAKQALAEGKSVPEEVLKDYPDLAPKAEMPEPIPLSPGSTVKVGKSPQTHTIVEELPATEAEMSLGERYFKVKNDKTGKVDTVEAGSLKSVKKSGGTKLYSGLPFDEFVAQTRKIFEGVRHLDKEFSPELKAMLNKAWRTSVFIVEKFPARKPVWDAHKQREDVRNEIKSKILSPDEMGYKGVDPFVSLPKEKSALLDRLLDEGDVRKRLFTDQELAKVDPEVAIAYKAAGEVIRREQSEIISGIERLAWIPYENKPWVNDLRRVMQEGGSIPENAPADFRRAAERILDTYDRIEMFKGQIKANPAYVPRVRENGSFVTRVHEVMPDGSTVERYAKIFKSEGQARRHEAEVKANPAKFMPRNYRQGAEYTFESADMAKLPEGLYNLHGTEPATLSIIKKGIDRLASKKEMSEAETDDMIQSISDAYLEQMAARGAGRHFLGRSENLIEGYDNTNYARIITRQAESMAGWLSKAEFAMRATKAISKMQPRDAEWSVSFVNDMLRNATAADQAVGMARGILTAKYMGYELGQMLVNSLQHYMTAIPEMSRHTKSAGMQMEKARLDVISGKLTDFDQKVIHDAVRRGEVLSRQVTELTGAAERGVGEISQNIGKVIDHSMRGFSAVEQHLNREPAFLAAMRLFTGAKKENGQYYGLNKNGKPYNHDYETAMRLARDFVDKTHYDVSAANMPEFFRKLGPAGKLVYTFSSFPVNYINWFVRRAAHKEFGVVGRALLATWAFGGFKALPGVGEDLDRMMQHNFGISPVLALRRGVRRMTKEYGLGMDEAIERVIIGGLPELADVNLTGRVSIKAPFGIMDPGKSPSEKIGGVWSALAQESLQAFDAAKNDDWYRAAESLAPRALKQPMQAERMYSEGMTTPRGETVFDESGQPMKLTGGEAARKAIGLQPSRMAGLQEKRGYEVNLKRVWEEKKSSIATRIRKHPERAGEEINKYNKALMDSDARTLVAPIGSETIERWLIPVPNQRRMMFQQDIDR